MNKLNQRQELFCQNMLLGKSATEAAKIAGYSEKTAQEQSSRLLSNVIICQRIATLQQAVTAGNIATRGAKLKVLEDIFTHKPLPEHITARDRVTAISEHNKMEGDYAPEKHAVLGDIVIEIIHKDKGG